MKTLYIAAAVALLGAAETASAQPARDGDVNVNVFVNYGFAYRDNTWVPVEVHVRNTKEDIKGYIELQSLAGGQRQNPTYRLPVESAKGSYKRFQLHCRLAGATEVQVQIYNGRRRVLAIPYTLQVQPIPEEDLLGLVLDEKGGAGFGFLFMAVNRENRDRGFHRECLENSELAFLSDLPQSYDPVDVIIVGEAEVDRIGLRSREMIRDFVRRGGRLVVCTGKNARLYRGTWLEDLLGVRIGPEETVAEPVLAADAFPAELRAGVREGNDCIVARLTSVDPAVTTLGHPRVLAARRPYGRGAIYTLAVDAEDGALQTCEGYAELWREICLGRLRPPEPAFAAATAFAAETLPRISGIVIHSKTSVMTYLALYFLVGVVGNWLFFSWLRRREWAWATLVVFSLGFTGYAMFFGTTGRARVSEIEQIDVVRIPAGGGMARRNTLLGVLTAHTTRYDLNLHADEALAQDAYGPGFVMFGGPNLNTARPFTLVQGDAPRIEDFRVGASELRMVHIESDVAYPGGFEGRLRLEGGRVRGRWVNRTGRPIERAALLLDGRVLSVSVVGDELQINAEASGVGSVETPVSVYTTYTHGPQARVSENVLLNALPLILLSKGDDSGVFYSAYRDPNALRLDPAYGPMLCAWSPGTEDVAVLDAPIAKNVNWTLILEEVEVEGEEAYRWEPLEARVVRPDLRLTAPDDDSNVPAPSEVVLAPYARIGCGETRELKVLFTEADLVKRPEEIEVNLFWVGPPDHSLAFWPKAEPGGYRPEFYVLDESILDGRPRRAVYHIPVGQVPLEKWDPRVRPLSPVLLDNHTLVWEPEVLGSVGYAEMEELGLHLSVPYDAPGDPVRVLSGFVGRLPEEPACAAEMNDQHVFYLAVAARARYSLNSHVLGEVLPWR